MSCRLCVISREEPTLYRDEVCYIVSTKNQKGHQLRVMAVLNRHSCEPTAAEFAHLLDALSHYMNENSPTDYYYLVFGTYASIPDHYHIIGCDDVLVPEEAQLFNSKYTRCIITDRRRRIMIGIPAHNEAEHIADVVDKAKKYGDVLVLCNACTDKTMEIAIEHGAMVKSFPNSGYGFALSELFKEARTRGVDFLVTLDGDGQHDADEIPRLMQKSGKYDVVVGNRFLAKSNTPLHRAAVIRVLDAVYGVGDTQNGFRCYSQKAIGLIRISDMDMGASLEILQKALEFRLSIGEAPCTVRYLKSGSSFSEVLKHGMALVESVFWGVVWSRPYTVLGVPAMLCLCASLGLGVWALRIYVEQRYLVPNLTLLAGGFFLLSALLIFATFFITVQRRLLRELKP